MGRTNIEHNYEPTDPSEWSEEAKKNMFELSQTLSDMGRRQIRILLEVR